MAEANYSLFAELVEASDVFTKHGTEAWRSGNSVQEENAKRQWILKRRKILKEKNEAWTDGSRDRWTNENDLSLSREA
ncbi:hypothetical protein ACHAWO_000348 [Cyclotella atomus]|uniref:Uncharacterized protein n=1 Tax=Cyclotella atomus TaxID=382360 RepID=A0ABD3MT32_9STRA